MAGGALASGYANGRLKIDKLVSLNKLWDLDLVRL